MPAVASSSSPLTRPRPRRRRRAPAASVAREKRDHSKLIRFTSSELARITDRARLAGRPVACYIRESSLGPAPRARPTEFSDALIRTLARLSARLTELAQRARDQQLAGAADFDAVVNDVLALIRELD